MKIEMTKEEIEEKLANGELIRCEDCGEICEIEHALRISDGYVCENCADNYSLCCMCGENHHHNETTYTHGEYYCETCFNEVFTTCSDCGEIITRDDEAYYVDGGDYHVCQYCYDNYYSVCDDCENTFHQDDLHYNEDDECYYCSSCYGDHANSPISSYHTHKNHHEPIFHTENGIQHDDSNNLFLGAEIEVDNGNYREETAKEVIDIMNDFLYCEHDGSLNDGFEMITQPATLTFHKSIMNKYKEAFETLIRNGFRSHNTTTCGLHIHFNRSYLGANGSQEQEMAIVRLLYLTEKMWDDLSKFARRNLENCRWAKKYNKDAQDVVKEIKENSYRNEIIAGDRYMGVNLTNRTTIEFRIFKGTLKLNTYIASLQLVDLLVNLAKDNSISITDLQNYTFEKIIEIAIDKNYSEMIQYLQERRMMTETADDTAVSENNTNTNNNDEE